MYGLDQLGFTLRVLHASLLLPLYPRNKHLQKFFRLHVDADLGVGRDLVETLDHQTVAIGKMMQHVPFNLVPPVGHGFSPREIPPRLDIHVHGWRRHQRRVDLLTALDKPPSSR